MKKGILSIAAVLLPALLTPVWAADIVGKWITPAREFEIGAHGVPKMTGETVFSFKVDGTKLTGTVAGPQGETAISEGKINGDKISFVVVRSSGGNQVKMIYKGKVGLNEIEFTREVQGGMEQPRQFVARREFLRHNDFVPVPKVAPVSPPNPR